MPRHKGKKKKGRVVKPGQEAEQKTTQAINDTLKNFGFGNILGKSTEETKDGQMDLLGISTKTAG